MYSSYIEKYWIVCWKIAFFQGWWGVRNCWCHFSFCVLPHHTQHSAQMSRENKCLLLLWSRLCCDCVCSLSPSPCFFSPFILCRGVLGWGAELVQPVSSAAVWLEWEGGRVHLSRTLCFIFIKRAAFDLLPLWRVTAWTAAPHCCEGNRALTIPSCTPPQPFFHFLFSASHAPFHRLF